MISFTSNTSNLTEGTNSDDGIFMKGTEPFTVRYARIRITIKPISLGIVYTIPK